MALIDVFDKNKHTDADTQRRRLRLCEQCPHLLKYTRQCGKCGCLVSLKTKLTTEKCPVGKWQ